jgi:outer membrane protein assembly factor BamE (lipoprotein component of BamABCDE complex)
MFSKPFAVLSTLSLLAVGACTPVNSYQGFQVIDQSPTDVKPGQDTRATVQAKLGSPTEVATFDKNEWFYISQVSSKIGFYPVHTDKRQVTAIAFSKDGDKVSAVRVYSLRDGRVIAYNTRETPTRGREISAIEQLLGSISAAGALPPNQLNPNNHGNPNGGP